MSLVSMFIFTVWLLIVFSIFSSIFSLTPAELRAHFIEFCTEFLKMHGFMNKKWTPKSNRLPYRRGKRK